MEIVAHHMGRPAADIFGAPDFPHDDDFWTQDTGSPSGGQDFLAELTQHIPDRGEHQIRYYGHCSNRSQGVRQKVLKATLVPKPVLPLTRQQLLLRLSWAALITAQEIQLENSAAGTGLHECA